MNENNGKQDNRELHIIRNRKRSQDSNLKDNYGTLNHSNYCYNYDQNKRSNQNIVARLIKRETNFVKPSVSSYYAVRYFHQNVVPNLAILDIKKPPSLLLKFSPDGQHLIAFSLDQRSIVIYKYKGPAAGESLLIEISGKQKSLPSLRPTPNEEIRTKLFEHFFHLKHIVNVAVNEYLHGGCCLFTDDGNHIIVVSTASINADNMSPFYELFRNHESVSPLPLSDLANYTLHLIDIKNGVLCDKRMFKLDRIYVSHNEGLYLYHDILCVLSVQHQTIHVFQVAEEAFVSVRNIGRFCYDDDELHLSQVKYSEWDSSRHVCTTINTLKHRILVFLYKKAIINCRKERSGKPLCEFYQNFDYFCMLKMWKMQLIDKSHLLIRYASKDVVTLSSSDPFHQPSFFVVYNMVDTEVLAIFENTSDKLSSIFLNFCDFFQNAALHSLTQLPCSPSNNSHARTLEHRLLLANARSGGQTEAVKQHLAQLPLCSQCYSVSPYLDFELFCYDDKWVSTLEKPRKCRDQPISFYATDSGLLLFKIYAGVHGKKYPDPAKHVAAYIFHPSDPFVISVLRTNSNFEVNFHFRHTKTAE